MSDEIISAVFEATSFKKVHLDEGVYDAELTNIRNISPNQWGERISFVFKIHPTNDTISRPVNLRLTPKSQCMQFLQCLGCNPYSGEKVVFNDYIGRKCRVWLKDWVDKEGDTVSCIERLSPPKE